MATVEPPTRYQIEEEILPRLGIDEIRQAKIDLIEQIGSADSIRDFGGLWGVDGLYLLSGTRALGCSFAEMIDVTPREEFLANSLALQRERPVQINMIEVDFRTPELYRILRPVEVALLYDVLLHQDTMAEVVKGVTATTRERICVAQPVLKEAVFPLPSAAVNLQFYDEELKDELRTDSWWPKEPPVELFDTSKWMWGQTPSFIESFFRGYGWRQEYVRVHDLGRYWNFGFMRFAPAR
jgi:hypothetical protein